MIKRVFLYFLGMVLLLLAVVAINTLRQSSRQLPFKPAAPITLDASAPAARLAEALRYQTIANVQDPLASSAEFARLHRHLEQSFPRLHATLKREKIGSNALLYRWDGSDANAQPILLMAHQDVVPIAANTEQLWQHPPFAGVIEGGFIWGRGALDDKGNLLAIMEAVELLLKNGFQPKQTMYLAFGHDEEVGGIDGAKKIAAALKARQLRFEYILDEGMLITEGMVPGVDAPVALIGVAEKGYATVQMTVQATPGHSSMPPHKTAIGMMSSALTNLERTQLPGNIRGVSLEMFDTIAPEMQGLNRVMMSNMWLFSPLVQRVLEQDGATNALLRTTTALTMMHAGNKENVMPGSAEATVNFRIVPGETPASVLEHVNQVVDNKALQASLLSGYSAPSPVSSTTTPAYRTLNLSIREVFPGTLVAPGLTLGATDTRHFEALSDNIYRFSPIRSGPEDASRFHGTDERISVKNYLEMIQFYHQLLRNSSQVL